MFRNLSIASSDGLNIENNKFITKDTYGKKENDVTTNHFIDFEIPIFLKDISSFFNNIDIMHYAEFDILIGLIDELFKNKSMNQNNFIVNYNEYLNYYRIYFWNISRQIKGDNANKFINILTGIETDSCEVYIGFKTSASITLKYSKNDKLIVYKS